MPGVDAGSARPRSAPSRLRGPEQERDSAGVRPSPLIARGRCEQCRKTQIQTARRSLKPPRKRAWRDFARPALPLPAAAQAGRTVPVLGHGQEPAGGTRERPPPGSSRSGASVKCGCPRARRAARPLPREQHLKVSEAAPKPAPGAVRGGQPPADQTVRSHRCHSTRPAPALLTPQAEFSPCPGLYCFGDVWGAAPPSARSPCLAQPQPGREMLSEPSSPKTSPCHRGHPGRAKGRGATAGCCRSRGAAAAGPQNVPGAMAAWHSPGGPRGSAGCSGERGLQLFPYAGQMRNEANLSELPSTYVEEKN